MPAQAFPENVIKLAALKKNRELREYCQKNKIPMFVTVYIPDKDEFCSDIVSPISLNANLSDDRITEHLNIVNGFYTVRPKRNLMRLNVDGDITETEPVNADTEENNKADNEVIKYINGVYEYCKKNNLPMFVSAYISENDTYLTRSLTSDELNLSVSVGRIKNHIDISNGFHSLPPQNNLLLLDDENETVIEQDDSDDFDINEALAAQKMCDEDSEQFRQ